MKDITLNFEKQTIVLANKFSQRAAIVGTPEYSQLMAVRKEFPGFSVYVKPKQTSALTTKYGSMKYEDMVARIMSFDNAEKRDALMLEFNTLRADGKYAIVRSWYIRTVLSVNESSADGSAPLAA
ncbi:MAG: hypothetical protein IJ299_01050 [Oscillospiraceae bacterium]|nr:hypothetical protein [Oscillospiraceae bacterium]